MHRKHSHCSYCGHPYAEDQPWPRTCAGCSQISYRNPIPVVVTLLPVDGGLLCVRRSIEPGKGQLALPGGFLDFGESWQTGCVRELHEETGIRLPAEELRLFRVHSPPPPEGVILIFGLARPRTLAELPEFLETNETSERVILPGPQELAFSLHTLVAKEFFAECLER